MYSPRMRGGQPSFMATLDRPEEFSPHARGSTLCRAFIGVPFKIHPACAGVNPRLWRRLTARKNSPRMRGDQPGYTFVLDYWCEFPPRARGSTLVIALSADVVYIYPACAGISLGKAQLLSRYFNLPRRRGDQPRVTVMVASFSAFTPRARGSTMMLSQLKQRECQRLHKNSIGDIIPIYAE